MLPRFCNDTVTVLRASLAGGTRRERDWDNASSFQIRGCSIQEATASGSVDVREDARHVATLYAPIGSDIRQGDRVSIGGEEWCIAGAASTVGRSSRIGYMSMTVERWVG